MSSYISFFMARIKILPFSMLAYHPAAAVATTTAMMTTSTTLTSMSMIMVEEQELNSSLCIFDALEKKSWIKLGQDLFNESVQYF